MTEKNNEQVRKVMAALRALPIDVPLKDIVRIGMALIDAAIRSDNVYRANNDLAEEQRTYEMFSHTGAFQDQEYDVWSEFMFLRWVSLSPNLFAVAYRHGASNALAESTRKRLRRAVDGRRMIGIKSRAKVQETAATFRHLSKERAAVAIAEIVNLDPGTIRRYLSELFPGAQWKQ